MNDLSFDSLSRHAAARVSRRVSLLTLGTAGVAALAGPISGEAKKRKRKQKESVGKKAEQKCQQQVGQCIDFLTPICVGDVTWPDKGAALLRGDRELRSCRVVYLRGQPMRIWSVVQ